MPTVIKGVPIEQLMAALDGLVQECEYSASSGLPFNFPENRNQWTQLGKAKALLTALRENHLIERLEKARNDPLLLGTLYFGEGFGRFGEPVNPAGKSRETSPAQSEEPRNPPCGQASAHREASTSSPSDC